MIEHRPDLDVYPFHQIYDRSPAYAEGRRLWLAHATARPDDAAILRRACDYLSLSDAPIAVGLARRGLALEPASVTWRHLVEDLQLRIMSKADSEDERRELARAALDDYERGIALETSAGAMHTRRILFAEAAHEYGDLERAAKTACRVLADAARFDGRGGHAAHLVLGRIAFSSDDLRAAGEHLVAAVAGGGSPSKTSNEPDFLLAMALHARGERAAARRFLDACRRAEGSLGSRLAVAVGAWLDRRERGESPVRTVDND